jgi:hypothetical protein
VPVMTPADLAVPANIRQRVARPHREAGALCDIPTEGNVAEAAGPGGPGDAAAARLGAALARAFGVIISVMVPV